MIVAIGQWLVLMVFYQLFLLVNLGLTLACIRTVQVMGNPRVRGAHRRPTPRLPNPGIPERRR